MFSWFSSNINYGLPQNDSRQKAARFVAGSERGINSTLIFNFVWARCQAEPLDKWISADGNGSQIPGAGRPVASQGLTWTLNAQWPWLALVAVYDMGLLRAC